MEPAKMERARWAGRDRSGRDRGIPRLRPDRLKGGPWQDCPATSFSCSPTAATSPAATATWVIFARPLNRAGDMDNAMIDKALAMTVRDQHPLHVQLSGGEPFLVPHQVAHAARMIRRIHPSATLGIQTNGTCLNPPALDLIRECELQVGVSLDGDPPVQEATRAGQPRPLEG